MFSYAGVAGAKRVEQSGNELIIEVDDGSESECLFETNNRQSIEDFVSGAGYKLKLTLLKNEEQILIEKLKQIIGKELKIEE